MLVSLSLNEACECLSHRIVMVFELANVNVNYQVSQISLYTHSTAAGMNKRVNVKIHAQPATT